LLPVHHWIEGVEDRKEKVVVRVDDHEEYNKLIERGNFNISSI
jgi:hypothetical protein